MRKINSALLIATLLVVSVILFTACEPPVVHPLDGNWNLTTTSTLGAGIGNGTVTLNFLASDSGIDLYQGSATVNGVDFDAMAMMNPAMSTENMFLELADPADETNYITFYGTHADDLISGEYDGGGTYAGEEGEFTMQ